MTNEYLQTLSSLINFGIDENEKLTKDERNKKINEFRQTLSYNKYRDLFNDLENYILDENIDYQEKERVVLLIIEFIRSFSILEDNIEIFPIGIRQLYKSYLEFYYLNILFEQVYYSDICMVRDYENIINNYFNFLDNPINELFINNCYSKIFNFNKMLIDYLDKTEFTGNKHRDIINNPELEDLLKNRLNILNSSRN